jgi:hypothetical protein
MNKESATELKIHHKPIVRWTLLTAGTILVGIGILGIFLPLLPTTVFFLMAAWCYARSSRRFYDWLHHNKYFGKYLKNYREGKGVTVLSKVSSVVILWGGIIYSIVVTDSLSIHLILLAIAIGVTIHIIVIPTFKSEGS